MNSNVKEKNRYQQADDIFQKIFSPMSVLFGFITSVVLLLMALCINSDFWIFSFIFVLIYTVTSLSVTLPGWISNWYNKRKKKNYYTWSRLRPNTSVSDFSEYFFNKSNKFEEEDIQYNFERDKQIVEYLDTFSKKDLKIGLALLSSSKVKNPIFTFLSTSTLATLVYRYRYNIVGYIREVFSIAELPSFFSTGLKLELIILLLTIISMIIIEWNHRSYLIKMCEIAIKYKQE